MPSLLLLIFFLAIGFLLLVTREDVDVFFEALLLLGFFFTRLTTFFLAFLRVAVLRRVAGFLRVAAFLRRGLRVTFLAVVFLRRRGLAVIPTFFFLRFIVFLLRVGVDFATVERFLRRFGAADFLFTGIKSSPLENLTFAGIGTHT